MLAILCCEKSLQTRPTAAGGGFRLAKFVLKRDSSSTG